ncbi:hypothetical protein GCM10023224_05360 [Streptomonospora halophila]|uniref:Uncharacterized protein n=1 Tax=Streptomonospora halophila TaxID=427369 RepID=A0ABP9G6V7_9ACTN
MTPSETTTLARLARACCPQQHFDEYTPDAWHDLLGDLAFDDCREALVAAAKAKPFVSPAEIRSEVKRIRKDRLANADLALPPADPDARDYSAQLKQMLSTLADGKRVGPAIVAAPRAPSAPTDEYVAARAQAAPPRAAEAPEPRFGEEQLDPPGAPPWCGRCHQQSRTLAVLTESGDGFDRVACPTCSPKGGRS